MIMKKIKICFLLLVPAVYGYSQADEPIPFANFMNITINLSFPQYRALNADGGFVEIEGGLRGIIVYRESVTTFLAYERNCPYAPLEACANVDVDISRIFLVDRCCGSNFSLSDGYPTKGPASRPLRRYRIQLSGTTLTISDEIVN
jgi:nitrite reductase/ring-hydroxylating ferredoxin subunit